MNPGDDAPKPPSAAEASGGGSRSTDVQLIRELFDSSKGWKNAVIEFGDDSHETDKIEYGGGGEGEGERTVEAALYINVTLRSAAAAA